MDNEYVGDVYVVAATKDGATEYWAAAVPQANALAEVGKSAPGWQLTLTNRRLSPDQIAELEMQPDRVQKLKKRAL